jgi:catechol 2,3-dioxygenase-like lactoylglutathione lyase family enzyme
MKRFHVHVAVDDLAKSTRFYAAMFGMPPTVEKVDYVKWMLDDPRINFAISSHGAKPGLDHLGIQVDSADELDAVHAKLLQADATSIVTEDNTACCYAKSDKHWITDPSGIAWESFHTLDTIPTFNNVPATNATSSAACCAPADAPQKVKVSITNLMKSRASASASNTTRDDASNLTSPSTTNGSCCD